MLFWPPKDDFNILFDFFIQNLLISIFWVEFELSLLKLNYRLHIRTSFCMRTMKNNYIKNGREILGFK
jgi:hypothetical protein